MRQPAAIHATVTLQVFERSEPRRYDREIGTTYFPSRPPEPGPGGPGSLSLGWPGFVIELPLFAGPFRLLASLILEQRMDVCDVPVARVTERFLEEGANTIDGWSLEEATWFLATCAALLEIKVGRLLPRPAVAAEEDPLGGDSPDLVYARSLELTAFRRVSVILAEKMAEASLMVARPAGPPPEWAHLYPDIMERVSVDSLKQVAAGLLAAPKDLDLSHVTVIRVSLADAVEAVRRRLSSTAEAGFADLIDGCEQRIEIVIRFLALLELYRQGEVELSQAEVFGDIRVRWQGGEKETID